MKTAMLLSAVLSVSLVCVALWMVPAESGPVPVSVSSSTVPTVNFERVRPSAQERPEASPSSPAPSARAPESTEYRQAPSTSERRHGEPVWAVPFGQEFWRAPSSDAASAPTGRPVLEGAGIDVGDAIARVSHALRAEDELAALTSATYRVEFDDVVRFSPHRPVETASDDRREKEGEPSRPAIDRSTDTEIGIETRLVKLGREVMYRSGRERSPWAVVGNTAQRLLDEPTGLLEHYETRPEGVEVTWVLPERPAATGDLVIDLALGGATFAGETEAGFHFADASGLSRASVGPVRVVDAAGDEWEADVEARGDGFRARVSGEVLAMARYPLAVDPVIGPEFGVDEPVLQPLDEVQKKPSLAFDPVYSRYFVTWEYIVQNDGSGPAYKNYILGTRLTSDAAVLDPSGIEIHGTDIWSGTGTDASVACAQGRFLVVWKSVRSLSSQGIRGARVRSSDGELLDQDAIDICVEPWSTGSPSVASDGQRFLVAWEDNRDVQVSGRNIYGCRVSATSGTVLDPGGFAISQAPRDQRLPALASVGHQFLVVWEDLRNNADVNIYGARVDAVSGQVLDPAAVPVTMFPEDQSAPAVAADGEEYLVVWRDARRSVWQPGNHSDIYAAGIRPDGSVVHPSGLVISEQQSFLYGPTVASNGDGFLIAWGNYTNDAVYGAMYRASTLQSVVTLVSDVAGADLVAASDGSDYLVAWAHECHCPGDTDIAAKRFDGATGAPLDATPVILSSRANVQQDVSVAFSGTVFLAVWSDFYRDMWHTSQVYGARLSSSGELLDPSGIEIGDKRFDVDVASDGRDFLVVLQGNWGPSGYGIRAVRLSGSTGDVLDEEPILVSPLMSTLADPAVASNGENYLVVWMDGDRKNGNYYSEIYSARVRASDGTLLDADAFRVDATYSDVLSPVDVAPELGGTDPGLGAVATAPEQQGVLILEDTDADKPDVASDGTDYYVVWSSNLGIVGVSVDGSTGRPRYEDQSVLGEWWSVPAVAHGAGHYLVTWTSMGEVQGRFVDAQDLTPQEPLLVLNGGNDHNVSSAVASAGGLFLVVWAHSWKNEPARSVLVSPVDETGSFDPVVGWTRQLDAMLAPSLVAAGDSRFLLAYHEEVPELQAKRVRARFISLEVSTLDLVENSDLGISSTDNITRDATPTFAGRTEPHALVALFDGTDGLGATRADDAGDWEFTSPALSDGTHSIRCRVVVSGGLPLPHSEPLSVTIDTVRPEDTIITLAEAPGALTNGGSTTSDQITFHVEGVDSGPVTRFFSNVDNRKATASRATIQLENLTPGRHVFQVWAVDVAGNLDSEPARFEWTVLHGLPADHNLQEVTAELDGVREELNGRLGQPILGGGPLDVPVTTDETDPRDILEGVPVERDPQPAGPSLETDSVSLDLDSVDRPASGLPRSPTGDGRVDRVSRGTTGGDPVPVR